MGTQQTRFHLPSLENLLLNHRQTTSRNKLRGIPLSFSESTHQSIITPSCVLHLFPPHALQLLALSEIPW